MVLTILTIFYFTELQCSDTSAHLKRTCTLCFLWKGYFWPLPYCVRAQKRGETTQLTVEVRDIV